MSHILLDQCFTNFKNYIVKDRNSSYLTTLKKQFMKGVKNEFTNGSVEIKKLKDRKHSFNELASFLDFCELGSWSDAGVKFEKAYKEYTMFVNVLDTFNRNADNIRKHDETGDTTKHPIQNEPTKSTVSNKPLSVTPGFPNGGQTKVQVQRDQNQTASQHKSNQVSSTTGARTTSQNQGQTTPRPSRDTGEYNSQKYQDNNDDKYEGTKQYPMKEESSDRTTMQEAEKVSVTKEYPQEPDPDYDIETISAQAKTKDYISTVSTQAKFNTNNNLKEEKWKIASKINNDSADDDIYGRSEKASILLRVNNPSIADLSDPNRPTKLAERFSELYSNEYTDAFEELEKYRFHEGATVYHLLRVVRRAYDHCQNWNLKIEEELRKEKHAYSSQKKSTDSEHEKILHTGKQQEEKKLLVKQRKDMVVQKFKQDMIPTILPEMIPEKAKSKFMRYAEQCADIVWWMCVRNPPMYLEWLQDRPNDQPPMLRFNSDLYRAYTKSGEYVDFCVWPLVRLYKDGPILSKGIAQGMNK